MTAAPDYHHPTRTTVAARVWLVWLNSGATISGAVARIYVVNSRTLRACNFNTFHKLNKMTIKNELSKLETWNINTFYKRPKEKDPNGTCINSGIARKIAA